MQAQLIARQPTLLKEFPKDSISGKAGRTFKFDPSFAAIPVTAHAPSDGQHIVVRLDVAAAKHFGMSTLYAWLPHVEVIEENHPSPGETAPITNLERDKNDRGPQILTPIGALYLNDPVHPRAPDFRIYELTHNGERMPPTREMWGQLEAICLAMQPHRDKFGEPCMITSGYRPEAVNREVGGVPDSRHTTHADAIDFYFPSMTKQDMWDYFDPIWEGGLGMYGHGALHADCRPYQARWGTEHY